MSRTRSRSRGKSEVDIRMSLIRKVVNIFETLVNVLRLHGAASMNTVLYQNGSLTDWEGVVCIYVA